MDVAFKIINDLINDHETLNKHFNVMPYYIYMDKNPHFGITSKCNIYFTMFGFDQIIKILTKPDGFHEFVSALCNMHNSDMNKKCKAYLNDIKVPSE